MTIGWLVLWVVSGSPPLVDGPAWWWGMTLVGAVALDVVAIAVWARRGWRGAQFHGLGRTWTPEEGWTESEPAGTTRWRAGGGIGIGVGMGAGLGLVFALLLGAELALPLSVGAAAGFLIGLLLDPAAARPGSGRTRHP